MDAFVKKCNYSGKIEGIENIFGIKFWDSFLVSSKFKFNEPLTLNSSKFTGNCYDYACHYPYSQCVLRQQHLDRLSCDALQQLIIEVFINASLGNDVRTQQGR